MENLQNFTDYLLNKNERLLAILINEKNRQSRQAWRITDPLNYDYDILLRDYPYMITSLKQIGIFQEAIFRTEQLGVSSPYYVVQKRDLIPCASIREAIEKTIGMDKFLQDYLEPYFHNDEERLEDFKEAEDYLDDCLIDDDD